MADQSGQHRIRAAGRLSARKVLFAASVRPLASRLAQGEGLLFLVNLSVIVRTGPDLLMGLAGALVSLWTLALLYAANDLADLEHDLADPGKKSRGHGHVTGSRPGLARAGITLQQALACAVALAALGVISAGAVAGLFVLNTIYSRRLKSVPAADVAWVAVMGGLYVLTAGVDVSVLVVIVVGAMTGVCHLFQTLRDAKADAGNRVVTTVVFSRPLATGLMLVLCAAMFATAVPLVGVWVALVAGAPFMLWLAAGDGRLAWHLSRAAFAVVWLILIYTGAGLAP